jgi:hypothetical protein
MTILVFPSALAAAASFAAEARQWGRKTVGASSIAADPNALMFDVWEPLPFIGEEGFLDALSALVARHGVTSLYTPHAPTYHLLSQLLPGRLPGVALWGAGPFERQMDRVRTALTVGEAAIEAASAWGQAPCPLPAAVLGGLLAQAETIHGECSREKMLALCGIIPHAPRGDLVEIGALFGKSSYVINRVAAWCGTGATLCVDPWDLGLSVQTDAPEHIQQASGGWDWEIVHQGFLVALAGCAAQPFNYLRMTSAGAAEHYAQGRDVSSPEFGTLQTTGAIAVLHLDGNHDEAAVAEDFALWSPHVLAGGWIIFDDYHWPHGDGPRRVADRAIADYGARVARHFVAGGAMFVQLI